MSAKSVNARRAPVALLLVAAALGLPLAAGAQTPAPSPQQALLDFEQGKSDGERAAHGSFWWFLTGCAGGCAGLLSGWFVTPRCLGIGLGAAGALASVTTPFSQPPYPSGSIYIGRSQEYVRGYTEGFQRQGTILNVAYSAVGCLGGAATGAIVLYTITKLGGTFNP